MYKNYVFIIINNNAKKDYVLTTIKFMISTNSIWISNNKNDNNKI